jgi:hypothetical protein
MKKTDRKRLDVALDKALAPPRKMPKQALDNLLDEYDDPTVQAKEKPITTPVPEYRSTGVSKRELQESDILTQPTYENTTGVPEYPGTPVPEPQVSPTIDSSQATQVIPKSNFYRKANEVVDQLDRELTPAESKVFDHLIRLSVGFNKDWCQVRISTLQARTGYRSDKTVRAAINGLVIKGKIVRRTHHNNPLGDEYQIRSYSGNTGVPEYRSTAAENTPVLESKITGQLNTDLKEKRYDDDAALAGLFSTLREATKEVTGRDLSPSEGERWRELGEVLATELKIAAARTTVSSAPAFLAEHLRRRLWNKDKKQLVEEQKAAQMESTEKPQFTPEQLRECPDCFGTGMYYPEGTEFGKGVARCKHQRLRRESE